MHRWTGHLVASALSAGLRRVDTARRPLLRVAALVELDVRDRLLALHDARRALAVLLAHEVVEGPRLADVLRDVRRERRRHLAAPGEAHRELDLLDRGDDALRLRDEL